MYDDEAAAAVYPPISPTTFDLIVVGTGLPESILAAAASAANKTVLHLDPNPFYGSLFSSLPPHSLSSALHSAVHISSLSPLESNKFSLDLAGPRILFCADEIVDLMIRSGASQYIEFKSIDASYIYRNGELSSVPDSRSAVFRDSSLALSEKTRLGGFFKLVESHLRSEGEDESGVSERKRISEEDLERPFVDFLNNMRLSDKIKSSGTSQYMEFKSVDASYIYRNGELSSVPDSQSAVFMDSSLSLSEKTRLGGFFKMVESHLRLEGEDESEGSERKRISEEDVERSFVDLLNNMRLSDKIKSIILYAIAMVDYDQDDMKLCKHVLKTKDGINRLALYHSSVGRFSNALGAMIYPIYGQGELPQAFCRRAAVKGCIYVLRMSVTELLMDKNNGSYRGVKIASGQELFSQQVVIGPSVIASNSLLKPSQEVTQAQLKNIGLEDACDKVTRGLCITNASLKKDVTNILLVFPPKSLHSEQVTSVRTLQIGSNLAVCPSGMFVVYISTLCDDADLGKKSLHAAMNSIFSIPASEAAENSSSSESESVEVKPTLLWSALYLQEIIMGTLSDTISTTSTPDGNINYKDIVSATKEQFSQMFPDAEFFPEKSFVDPEDDALLDQSHDDDSLDS